MAVIHKIIKRWRGYEYILSQDKWNSRKCYVVAYWRKTNQETYTVAEIDNKTHEINWMVSKPSIPKQVREVIEMYATEGELK